MNAIEICSNALIRLGASPIQSFNDTSDTAVACKNIYPVKSNYILSSFPWRFTMKFKQLSRLSEKPEMQWSYKYNMPSDKVQAGFPAVYVSSDIGASPINEYAIIGNFLMSDSPEIYVQYQYRPDETLWPHYFTELMIQVMSCELSMNITDNATLRQSLSYETYGVPSEGGMGGLFGRAMNLDSKDSPTQTLQDNSLLLARFEGV